jgi:ApeA N-terminal domain 1
MLFTLNEIRPRLEHALGTWLERHDPLGPVFDLYLATLYGPTLFLSQRFWGYAQGSRHTTGAVVTPQTSNPQRTKNASRRSSQPRQPNTKRG